MSQLPNARHRRIPLNLYANKMIGDQPYLCRMRNLSESGVYLERLLEPELVAGKVGVEFRLPGNDDVLWVWGEVVRATPAGHGIRFLAMSQQDRALLSGFLGRQTRGTHELPS